MTTFFPANIQLHDEQLLTTGQVVQITGIAKQTFEGWRCRKDGGPEFKKLGPQLIRYRWLDIRRWRDSGAVTPTA
jgi:predicted DNA-binding transcriptional regulator AlpA